MKTILFGLALSCLSVSAHAAVIFDDMEHGDPFASGYFIFSGIGGGGLAANAADLPPENGGSFSLEFGWGSGGASGFFGGFGRTNPLDLTGQSFFNFWINPDAGQEYTLEVNLQDDDNGDGSALFGTGNTVDDEFQFDCVINAAGSCAKAGGGWQLVSIPFSDFFDDNSFYTGGNGVLDLSVSDNGGLGNVVISVLSDGRDVNFRTDYWHFTDYDPTEVPEPAVIWLFGAGLVGLAGLSRREKKA